MNGLDKFPIPNQLIKDGKLNDFLLPLRGYSVDELEIMEQQQRDKDIAIQMKRDKDELKRKKKDEYNTLLKQYADSMIPSLWTSSYLQNSPIMKDWNTTTTLHHVERASMNSKRPIDHLLITESSMMKKNYNSVAFGMSKIENVNAIFDIISKQLIPLSGLVPPGTSLGESIFVHRNGVVSIADSTSSTATTTTALNDIQNEQQIEPNSVEDPLLLQQAVTTKNNDIIQVEDDLLLSQNDTSIPFTMDLVEEVVSDDIINKQDTERNEPIAVENLVNAANESAVLMMNNSAAFSSPTMNIVTNNVVDRTISDLEIKSKQFDTLLDGFLDDDKELYMNVTDTGLDDDIAYVSETVAEDDLSQSAIEDGLYVSSNAINATSIPTTSQDQMVEVFSADDSEENLQYLTASESILEQGLVDGSTSGTDLFVEAIESSSFDNFNVTEPIQIESKLGFDEYMVQVAKILEAEREELLETQAILDAPPGAQSLDLDDKPPPIKKQQQKGSITEPDLEKNANIELERMTDDPSIATDVHEIMVDANVFPQMTTGSNNDGFDSLAVLEMDPPPTLPTDSTLPTESEITESQIVDMEPSEVTEQDGLITPPTVITLSTADLGTTQATIMQMDSSDLRRAEEERLETEAILNAPPAAESVDFKQKVEAMIDILSQTEQEALEELAIMNAPPGAESVDLPQRTINKPSTLTPSFLNAVENFVETASNIILETPPAVSAIDIAEIINEPPLILNVTQHDEVDVPVIQNSLEVSINEDKNENIKGHDAQVDQAVEENQTISSDIENADENVNVCIPAANEMQDLVSDKKNE